MNIFLLEDHPEVVESMTRALELRGHTVWWIQTVTEAKAVLNKPQAHHPAKWDLAILDLNLPDGLGTELIPLGFPAVIYSGLPDDAKNAGVPVFSKGDPFALLDYIEALGKETP